MAKHQMLAVQCKLCPVCDGTGIRDVVHALPKKRKEFECENCQGQRYVPVVTCRGCGRAAIQWDAKVPYCGRPKCWDALVEMIDPEKRIIRHFGPRYCPFPVFDNRRRFRGKQVWDPFKKEFTDSIDLQNRPGNMTPEQEVQIARAMSFGFCELGEC